MRRAYLVDVAGPAEGGVSSLAMRYVALVETPEQAVEAVRPLIAGDARVTCSGDTLTQATATALGLKPGQARLV